jgi:D-alanine--poly(phosphoribitol) ligase subunit 2
VSTSPAFEGEPQSEGGDRAALVEQLRGLFREVLNIEVPSPEADLIEGGLLDSLALVELLFEIEQRFAVDLALEELDIDNFRTLDRLAAVIADQTRSQES